MKLITRFDYAQTAPARWVAAYKNGRFDKQWAVITAKIEELKPPFDPDQIDALIGNSSWTQVASCSECGEHSDPILEVGQEPDYESRTAYLCLPCLGKLVALAATATQPAPSEGN